MFSAPFESHTANSILGEMETRFKRRLRWFLAISTAKTSDRDLSRWNLFDRLLVVLPSTSDTPPNHGQFWRWKLSASKSRNHLLHFRWQMSNILRRTYSIEKQNTPNWPHFGGGQKCSAVKDSDRTSLPSELPKNISVSFINRVSISPIYWQLFRACCMFYPYEGYRSVTPLDAARVKHSAITRSFSRAIVGFGVGRHGRGGESDVEPRLRLLSKLTRAPTTTWWYVAIFRYSVYYTADYGGRLCWLYSVNHWAIYSRD